MKKSLKLSLLFLLLASFTLQAQTLMYGLAKKPGLNKEVYLATVDPVSGSVTILSTSVLTSHVTLGGAALDNINNLYYYFSPDISNTALNAIDIISGEQAFYTTLSYPSGCNFFSIQFNGNDSSYYGLYKCASDFRFAKLNPNTGGVTVLSGSSIGSSTMDDYTYDKRHNIFYYNLNGEIRGIDYSTGSIVSTTVPALPSGQYFSNMEFNCHDSTMYGTYQSSSGLKLAKINLATGVVTVLSSSVFSTSYIMGGGHVLDIPGGKYYLNVGTTIFTLDIANGNLLNTASLTFSAPGTFNLLYIKESFPGDCLNQMPTAVNENEHGSGNYFFPNPVQDELTIKTNNNLPSEIILYDISSRKLFQRTFTSSATVNVSELAEGIYIYEVRNQNGTASKGKLIKTNP